MSVNIQTQIEGGILLITINRPEKKNALIAEMYSAIADALENAATSSQVRVAMLTGAGEAFTSGNDIQEFLNGVSSAPFKETPLGRFMHGLSAFPKPVIAAVNGLAIGIGATMLLHCDLVYAAAEARLQFPFVKIGLCPEFGSSFILPRVMGNARAAELMLSGEPFSAEVALAYGLVNAVVPASNVLKYALERATKLAQQPPKALQETKRLLRRWTQDEVLEAMHLEMECFKSMLNQDEAKQALEAFTAKRPAKI